MKKIAFITALSFLMLLSCQEKQPEKLTIAVAANMQFAIKDLSKTFTDKTGVQCELIITSSGKLTAQIKEGAPYDIFVSANMKYPNELFKSGFTTKEPEIYAYGQLVMWSVIDGLTPSIERLNDKQIKHIALANPKMAPYGTATIEVLEHYNLYDSLKDKLVYGESISQTNQFILSKSAEVGFTAKAVVLSSEMKNKGSWIEIDDANYTPIAQGVVIIKNNKAKEEAEKFYEFLFSTEAKTILENYGYKLKED